MKAPTNVRNTLLMAFSQADMAAVAPALRRVQLPHDQVVLHPGDDVQSVYFPETAVLSVITTMRDGRRIETATIGFESAVGIVPALTGQPIFSQVVAQIPGEAVCLPASLLRSRAADSPALMQLMLRFVHSNINQAEQSAACNALHTVEARLSRWLLMTSDRVQGDTINLTQEYLAVMAGVQRTTVTAVCTDLKNAGAIKYARGRIQIVDRPALEKRACECYAINRDNFMRLGAKAA